MLSTVIPNIAPPSSSQTLFVEIKGSKINKFSGRVVVVVVQLSVNEVDEVQLPSTDIVEASLVASIILHCIFCPSEICRVFVVSLPAPMTKVSYRANAPLSILYSSKYDFCELERFVTLIVESALLSTQVPSEWRIC